MTTDVTPTSDAELEWVRKLAKSDRNQIGMTYISPLLARLDAAEFETDKYMEQCANALQGKLDVKAERNRLAALNAELVEGLKDAVEFISYQSDHLVSNPDHDPALAASAVMHCRTYSATLAKARPQEPVA